MIDYLTRKREDRDPRKVVRLLLAPAVMLVAFVLHRSFPMMDIPDYTLPTIDYFGTFLAVSLVVYMALLVASLFSQRVFERLFRDAGLIVALYAVLLVIDLGSMRLGFINAKYIPGPDMLIGSFVDNASLIFGDLLSSARLWIVGIAIGAAAGFVYGMLMGWSRVCHYWLFPFIEVIGPIPGSIWMVVAVVVMPTAQLAGVFLIALAVWFPLAFNLGSAIRNLDATTIERARVLGASGRRILFNVALPSALPAVFSGLFMGICFSFGSLISAELLGVGAGIGWRINFYETWSQFDLAYSCMILIIVVIYLVIELLFQIQDRVLKWQKGVLRW